MNREELRDLQGPFKQKYTEHPEMAIVTLRASSRIAAEGIGCAVDTGVGAVEAGLHPSIGGDGFASFGGNMLLDALAACAGVTLKTVATSIGFELRDAAVSVEGELDVRGVLAVAREAPVGFSRIKVKFILDAGADPKLLDSLLDLTKRYSIVLQTISRATDVDVTCALK